MNIERLSLHRHVLGLQKSFQHSYEDTAILPKPQKSSVTHKQTWDEIAETAFLLNRKIVIWVEDFINQYVIHDISC